MEESYETFEELWPPRAEPPPQKPVRPICRPEMQTSRTVKEEGTPVPQQPRSEPRAVPQEPSFAKTSSLRKSFSIQNLTQVETPWENVTLNRCLFVAITILVLTSGFQKLHETFRGEGTIEEEEEVALRTRRSGMLRHRGQQPEPETSLWEVMFSWLPTLDDEEDEEDDDEKIKKGKSKRAAAATRELRRLRNRPLPEKKLLKQRDGKVKDKKGREAGDKEVKGKKGRAKKEDPEEMEDEKDEEDEQIAPKKIKKLEEKKDKKE